VPAQRAQPADVAFPGGDRSLARTNMVSKAANFSLPVDWTIQRRGDDGSWAQIPQDQRLRVGDSVRLVLRPSRNGFLTVWQREASGGRRALFTGPAQWGSAYIVPAEGALRYDEPGPKVIYARLSEREEPLAEAGAMGILLDYR